MMVTRADKEKAIVDLHNQGKGTKDISSQVHMSFRDISRVLRKHFPEEYADERPVLTTETRALKLFSEGKTPVEVAIDLNMKPEDTSNIYRNYLGLKREYLMVKLLEKYKDESYSLLSLLREVKKSGLGLRGVASALKNKRELLEAKTELETIRLKIGESMVELAELELDKISSRSSRSCIMPGTSSQSYDYARR